MKKYKNGIIIVVLAVVAIGFFVWGAATTDGSTWRDTNVACLPNGHTNLAVHIHPALSITVDGEPESIPANTGVNAGCMAEVHTHDTSGLLHVETVERSRIDELTLADFFDVWGKDLEREGYTLTARVDGEVIEDPAGLTFEDEQQIELEYASSSNEDDAEEGEAEDQATSTLELEVESGGSSESI
ncbi:MAG: hypothetical protein WDZ82_01310 [Candidatus Paceibacterota bacterium]